LSLKKSPHIIPAQDLTWGRYFKIAGEYGNSGGDIKDAEKLKTKANCPSTEQM
jgi:hypothetical protein